MANKKATSFNLSEDLKKRFRVAVAERGTDQSAVVRQCIESWLSTPGDQGLQEKSSKNKTPSGFPGDPPSGTLKGAQLVLFRDLVEKVANIIAAGDQEKLKLLVSVIRVSSPDIPPDQSVEASPSERVPKPMPRPTGTGRGKPT